MDPVAVGIIGILAMVLLMALGLNIAFTFFVVGAGGTFYLISQKAFLSTMATAPFFTIANYTLSTIPMFILMGYYAFQGGVTQDIFNIAVKWIGRLPGGLAMAAIVGCTAFAFCSGSSLAGAAVMGQVTIPEMRRYGYDKRFASGVVAAGGALAAMIPPSITMIIYGVLTETPIAPILIGGILPGLMTCAIYLAGVYLIASRKPHLAPLFTERFTWRERLTSLKGGWGVAFLAALVIGGIYSGLFSPTEAGAAGAAGALLLGLGSGRMALRDSWKPVLETATTTAQIFIIIAGALLFSRMLTFSGVTHKFSEWIVGLPFPPMGILIVIMLMYIGLGCIMEPLGMLFITLPIIFPAIKALGIDPIWFGILLVKVIEIGVITPPVGMNVYVLKTVTPDITLDEIFQGIGWMLVMEIIALSLLLAFPSITLFLPNLMIK
jgi:tripartite ATP-independent transporter DctM subunit